MIDKNNQFKPKNGTKQTLKIKPGNTNKLNITFKPHPKGNAVASWPSYIAMGAVSSTKKNSQSLKHKNVDAIFKYAGASGGGDRGKVILPAYTYKTIKMAQAITQTNNHRVKPVMVVYTANMSGGATYKDLFNQSNLTKHFINLILITQELQYFKGDNPGSIVLNPDLLGTLQQGNHYKCSDNGQCSLGDKTQTIQVKQALHKAITFVTTSRDWAFTINGKTQITINNATPLQVLNRVESGEYADKDVKNGTDLIRPFNQKASDILNSMDNQSFQKTTDYNIPDFNNTFKGWISATNWIINNFGPDITYGWQENVWNSGSATWVHNNFSKQTIYNKITQPTLKLWNKLGVYNGPYKPDFIVFDKYERDPLGQIGFVKTGWAWNARDWNNYMQYVKQMSEGLHKNGSLPVKLW